MSNLAPFQKNTQPGLPTPPRGVSVARYNTYAEAQRAVDYLSDEHFAVQAVTIVGTNLQMVERVTGRLTYSRVAIAGMASGAWFGLFVGLLISIFGNAQGFSLFAAIFIGAAFGLLFGLMSYAFTGGRRDFTSTSQIVAGEYSVLCLEEQAGKAQQLLRQLPGGTGKDDNGPGLGSGGPGPTAPATGAPIQPPPPFGAPQASGPEQVADPAPQVSGPTYGEMLDRKRREEQERADH
jgi:hypothetical protein